MAVSSGGQHGQAGPTASKPTFRLIQILRAFAALMVVAHHTTIMLAQRNHLPIANWISGGSGVDLFFIISGFVMTVSAAPLRQATHPARTFLARRLERIVPMYWIVTTIKLLVLLAVPVLGMNALGSTGHILASYLFFPSLNSQGFFEPVVIVGWTLNFEVAFYLVFAVALALRARPVWIVGPVLLGIVLLPFCHVPAGPVWFTFFRSTLLLEFLFGVLLAMALPAVRCVPWQAGLLLVVLGLGPLVLWKYPNFSYWRGLLWGIPALAVVSGALSMESRWGARSPRWALTLGDASYSIYLVHTFALPAVGLLLNRLKFEWPGEVLISFVGAIIFSTAAGLFSYKLVEQPLTDWFKGRRRTAVPVVR
ncbi:MAG: acyltransferase family protein [Janthinobacterium lividum]